MERRQFLKIAFGFTAGAAAIAATAHAAPLLPQPLARDEHSPSQRDAHPAVTSKSEVDNLEPEQVRHGGWHGRGHHWGWRRRHWGWRRRHWGWHRRHWRRRHW
jgi:hypothetical protein